MNRSLRFGTALSALAMTALLSACAAGQNKVADGIGAAQSRVGMAMRAQLAVESGDFATAVGLAEQAVQGNPGEAQFRTVLGNAYFGAGRFASAEAAYRDSLSLASGQPAVALKLALARIAQGKQAQALADLEAARDYLDAADYGLALALAGRPADAVAVLGQAARLPGTDARLRQNLAIAHALSGDWTMARTIAAQDVPPEQLDSRIQQWMAMATPTRASDQVAALTGIRPAADPGQPLHLALNQAPLVPVVPQAVAAEQTMAEVAPLAQPVHYDRPEPLRYVEPRPRPKAASVDVEIAPEEPAVVEAAGEEQSQQRVAQLLIQPAARAETPAEPLPTRFESPQKPARLAAPRERKPERANGKSGSVVQLGAYGSPERVAAAWDQFARRFTMLSRYTPVSMRFSSPSGTVYRLSVKGFESAGQAKQLCGRLQSMGKNCFVRRVAGDSPVRFASR